MAKLSKLTLKQRFWNKVNKTDSCWIWMGWKNPQGYGKYCQSKPRMTWYAHRLAWEFENGYIPPNGFDCCHSCDNTSCVNPSHLFIGSRKENIRDCIMKGRISKGRRHSKIMKRVAARGEKQRSAKLSSKDVLKIRYLLKTLTPKEISKRFGVTPTPIYAIKNGQTWKHV